MSVDDRLKNLKKAMDKTAFQHVTFSETHEATIKKQLHTAQLKETMLALLTDAKSGVDLTQLLHVRGAEQIVGNEGLVYTMLHEAEQQGFIVSSWVDGVKYYELTKLGKKQIQQQPKKLSIKERLLGVRMHAE